MDTLPEIGSKAQNATYIKPEPGIALELPFADIASQEAIEPRQEVDDLRHEQPDVGNPVSLPWEDESRQSEPQIEKRLFNNLIKTKCEIDIEASNLCCNR